MAKKTVTRGRTAKSSKSAKSKPKTAARKSVRRTTPKTTKTVAPTPTQPTMFNILKVDSVPKAVAAYTKLGFNVDMTMPGPGGEPVYGMLSLGSAVLHVGPVDGPGQAVTRDEAVRKGTRGLGVAMYTMVKSLDKTLTAAKAAGFQIIADPEMQFWGDKTFGAVDLDGYEWQFAQHIKDVSPAEMAEAMKQLQ